MNRPTDVTTEAGGFISPETGGFIGVTEDGMRRRWGGADSAGAVVALQAQVAEYRKTLTDMDCTFWACPGPDAPDTPMATCSRCQALIQLADSAKALAAHDDAEWQRRLAEPETRERLYAALAANWKAYGEGGIAPQEEVDAILTALRAGPVETDR